MPRTRRTVATCTLAVWLACVPGAGAHAQTTCVYDPTANGFLPAVAASSPAVAVGTGVTSLASTVVAAALPTASPARPLDDSPWDAAPDVAPEGLAPGLTAALSGPC